MPATVLSGQSWMGIPVCGATFGRSYQEWLLPSGLKDVACGFEIEGFERSVC